MPWSLQKPYCIPCVKPLSSEAVSVLVSTDSQPLFSMMQVVQSWWVNNSKSDMMILEVVLIVRKRLWLSKNDEVLALLWMIAACCCCGNAHDGIHCHYLNVIEPSQTLREISLNIITVPWRLRTQDAGVNWTMLTSKPGLQIDPYDVSVRTRDGQGSIRQFRKCPFMSST